MSLPSTTIEEGSSGSRVGKSKLEDAVAHESNILYVTILQKQNLLEPIPYLYS